MVGYNDGSLDKSTLCFLQQGGWMDALESTWKVKVFMGSPDRQSEREKPQLGGSEVGLDAGRGDWVPTSWWCSPSQGFGKDRGAPSGFGMRRGHSRVPARLIGDCYSSSPLWGNALAPSSRMPPDWHVSLTGVSGEKTRERPKEATFHAEHSYYYGCIVRFFGYSQRCNQTRFKYTNKCSLKGQERTCKERWAYLTEWVMCSLRGKWDWKQLAGSINRSLIWMTCPWANCIA